MQCSNLTTTEMSVWLGCLKWMLISVVNRLLTLCPGASDSMGCRSAEEQKQLLENVLRCSLLKETTSENHVVCYDALGLCSRYNTIWYTILMILISWYSNFAINQYIDRHSYTYISLYLSNQPWKQDACKKVLFILVHTIRKQPKKLFSLYIKVNILSN